MLTQYYMYKRKLHYFDHPPTNSRPLIKDRCSHHIHVSAILSNSASE